jgi:hypothetical protein
MPATAAWAIYSNCSANFLELVKGSCGKTPIAVDPDFRQLVTGVRKEKPYDTSAYQPQSDPVLAILPWPPAAPTFSRWTPCGRNYLW